MAADPYPDWIIDAMPLVKSLCAPDVPPTLSDPEIAECIAGRIFRATSPPDLSGWVDDPPRVDVYAAVHDAWIKKAGKVSGDYAFSEGGLSDHPEQVYQHCMAMADRYNPPGIA